MTHESTDGTARPTILSEAASAYLASLEPDRRRRAGPEVSKFARWYGGERTLRSVTPADVERYLQQLGPGRSTADLEPLRDFLADLERHNLVELPVAAAIRIRRKAAAKSAGEAPRPAAAPSSTTTPPAPTEAGSGGGLRCPACGETEHLRGTRAREAIVIACSRCGTSWERDVRPICRRCGRTDLIPEARPLVDRVRGNQTAITGGLIAYRCPTCDN